MADKTTDGITRALASFVAFASFEDFPATVVDKAKLCLLDAVGCGLGGSRALVAGKLLGFVDRRYCRPTSTILSADGPRSSPILAGFVNAGLVNALDYDDTLLGHHGATIIPTVLAFGETLSASGRQLIEAIVVGYEVSIRTMACLSPFFGRFSGGWDLGTLQTLGVAAAGAKLLGLDVSSIVDAMGIAFSTAPCPMVRKARRIMGARSEFKSGYSWSVQAGMEAVLLASEGLRAQDRCLDGDLVLWQHNRNVQLQLESLTDDLGKRFMIEYVVFKAYPACRFLHSALQAAETIIRSCNVKPESIKAIEVGTFRLLADEYHKIPHPASFTEAQFSLPFCLGLLIARGKLTPAEFTPEAIDDEEVLELAAKVVVKIDKEAEEHFPEREQTTVSIWVKERRTPYIQKVLVPPKLSDKEVKRKFRTQASLVCSCDSISEFIQGVERLEHQANVQCLVRSLFGKGGESCQQK